ncbi:MAG TPA: phosphotransferase [Rhizobiaceae bacterium]|nr:phosphotransferase [Rhizobiaceae bacterium]
MTRISIGISRSDKLFVQSKTSYPYFVKIGEAKNIKREDSKYGQAARKIPALSIPPKEILLEDKINNVALISFRYVTGSHRQDNPASLFYHYQSMDVYDVMSLIDDLFHAVLHDFHSFRTAKYESHEVPSLDESIFKNDRRDESLNKMVEKYNNFVSRDLRYISAIGPIHGDLHTENILVGRYDNPILIDFEMSLQDNCLLKDFAEFEIALLLAVATTSFDEIEDEVSAFYKNRLIFGLGGIGKFPSSASRIRANLCESLSEMCRARGLDMPGVFREAAIVYRIYLLRYLCFYARIANLNQTGMIRRGIISLFEDVFNILYERLPAEPKLI